MPISAHSLIALSRCSKSPSKVLDISVLQDLRHHGKCTLAFRLGRTHHPVSERFGHFEKRPSILHLLLGWPRANPSARVCLFAAGQDSFGLSRGCVEKIIAWPMIRWGGRPSP